MPAPHLRGLTPDLLARLCPRVRPTLARRLVSHVVGGFRDDIEYVPGLSRELARVVRETGRLDHLTIIDRRASTVDPFAKYLFEAPDGARFETVRIPLELPRYSVCVSSQAGCPLGCAFCETGRLGLTRDLEPWEMVEQVLSVRAEALDRPVTGVVFQGQGEPLLNYDNVLQAAAVLRDPCGARIGADRITISTVGIPPRIDRYTDEGHPFRLILSLTSTSDERRGSLIPVARRHSVADVAIAMRRYARARRVPVHLAWVLIQGVNTGRDEVEALASLFPDVRLRVSLIDVNDPSGGFLPPSDDERAGFMTALNERGIAFIRRYSGGADIRAACGQLASTSRGGTILASSSSPG